MNLANFGFELSRMAFENGEADIAKKYATAKIAANRYFENLQNRCCIFHFPYKLQVTVVA